VEEFGADIFSVLLGPSPEIFLQLLKIEDGD
jgi:hypothetical protein